MQEDDDSNGFTEIDDGDDYKNKVDAIMAEQNTIEKETKREADELFLPRERKELMKDYKELLETMHNITESPLHRKITRGMQSLMNAEGYSFVKAASICMKKK